MKKTITTILLTAALLCSGVNALALTQEEVDYTYELSKNYYYDGLYYESLTETEKLLMEGSWSEDDYNLLINNKNYLLYAIDTMDEVYSWFNKIQSYCDQGMYYEARDELALLAQTYDLTYQEEILWNTKKADVEQGIINYNNTLLFNEINNYYNNGMYYEANSVLTNMNTSTMSYEHKQLWNQWNEKINAAIANIKNEAQAAKNKEKLSGFYVGCNVRQYVLWLSQRTGIVRAIDYNTGKVKVYWSQGYDENGYASTNPFIDIAYLGIGKEEWCDPDSLIIM